MVKSKCKSMYTVNENDILEILTVDHQFSFLVLVTKVWKVKFSDTSIPDEIHVEIMYGNPTYDVEGNFVADNTWYSNSLLEPLKAISRKIGKL